MTDDKNTVYRRVGSPSTNAKCSLSSEVWYTPNVVAGVKRILVTMPELTNLGAWVIEASGLSRTDPVDQFDAFYVDAAVNPIEAPIVTPSTSASLVVSTTTTCGKVTGMAPTSSFVNLPVLFGNAAAWLVTTTPGSYGAKWMQDDATFMDAMTVAFKL